MKISDMIIRIQSLADKKLSDKYDFEEYYASVGVYGGLHNKTKFWQVWIDFHDSDGITTHEVVFEDGGYECFLEEKTLEKALQTTIKYLEAGHEITLLKCDDEFEPEEVGKIKKLRLP